MKEQHIKGDWHVIRMQGITIAQGYRCSCGVTGCKKPTVPSSKED
jgi:hypothetical protein